MSKDRRTAVPKLRFPEFENEWEERKIEDLFDVGSSKRVLEDDWSDCGVPFYRTRELVSLSKNASFGSEVFISEELFQELSKKYGVPTAGDFLVSGVGTLGICYQVMPKDRFYFKDGNVLWLKSKSRIHSTFFKYCFQADFIQNQILGQASISTVGTYTIQNAKKTKVWCPQTSLEQQKIASCLSSLDDLIAAHSQKLDALKAHKKGLMQQLFPAEGETVPRVRFKEFEGSGEWEEKMLTGDDVAEFVKEKVRINGMALESYVSTENLLPDFGGVIAANKLPASGSFTSYRNGDVLLSNIRPYLRKVWFATRAGATSNDVIVIRPKRKLHPVFLSYLLKTNRFIEYIMKGAEGVKMPRGDKDKIKEYPVVFPELEEQQKIAFCLSSLDALIAAQAEKVEALKAHKKGLMQGLFPAVDRSE